MLLPNIDKVRIDPKKLTDYVLNTSHPEGRHKARVFMSALGVAAADGEWLANAILASLWKSGRVAEQYGLGADLPCGYGDCSRATVREGTNDLAMLGRSG